MVNLERLRIEIKKSGKTVGQIAAALGMDSSTFYRKLNRNGATFTIGQASELARILNLNSSVAQEIFFDRELA